MNTFDRIQQEKESLKARIALRDSLYELQKSKAYYEVIEKAFMVEDCARYARLSGLHSASAEVRADATSKSQAAGHLQEYLEMVVNLGNAAEKSLQTLMEQEGTFNTYDMED